MSVQCRYLFQKEASLFTTLVIGILELITDMSQTTKVFYLSFSSLSEGRHDFG